MPENEDEFSSHNKESQEPCQSNQGPVQDMVSRRAFVGAAALASAGFMTAAGFAQSRQQAEAGRQDDNASDPGPENRPLVEENPDSYIPPFTDTGNPGPVWFSFDVTPKRLEAGGWTHEVTERELPTSKDLVGVNMRLTAGSFRELHWHTADEWAIMLAGKARVSVMQPDGKMFIDDVEKNDLWYFPAGFPHSIQGLEGEGCEFLLVFDQGSFSEDDTFLISEFLAHVPPEVVQKNMGWNRQEWNRLPSTQLYIFEAQLPGPLEDDRRFLGDRLETKNQYTFKMSKMSPTTQNAGGEVRIVDSTVFPVALHVAMAQVTLRPGAIRELHWHPNVSEWQYWIQGSGRMTVVNAEGKARTMNFHANDVGFVTSMAGHYIENTGKEDLIFLEMFKAPRYMDFSLNEWIARMPDKMAMAHLKLPISVIRRAPPNRNNTLPK
jgi:oxalate decarboxylase